MTKAWGALLALLALVSTLLVVAASSAGAQEEQQRLTIRSVDGTDPDSVVVDFLFAGNRQDLNDLTIRENGVSVDTSPPELIEESQQLVGTVLLLDTSASMADEGKFAAAVEAAQTYVEGMGPNDRIAIVSFDIDARVEQEFTDDQDVLLSALDGLELGLDTALFDGVRVASELYEGSDLQPNMILLSDGEDTSSETSPGAARRFVSDTGALVFAVALGDDAPDSGAFIELTEASGGRVLRAGGSDDLAAIYSDIQNSLQTQYRVTFSSRADDAGLTSLVLAAAGERVSVDYSPGSRSSGSQLIVTDSGKPPGPDFLRSTVALYLIGLLVIIAVGGAAYAVITVFVADRKSLDSVLRPYHDGFVASAGDDDDEGALAQTPFMKRAVALTGQLAERRGVLERVELALERANLPLRAPEAIFFYAAVVVVVVLLAAVLGQSIVIGVIFGGIVALVGPAILNYLAARRRRQFQAQLPDTLQLFAGTLRAGFSLMQGVEAVSQEVSEPMARELLRVVTEARLGRPLEESLDAVAERMDSPDFAWAVMAIRIQREVGGNLSELLMTVADTMVARERLRRDISALTAEGKISAIVLGMRPVALGVMMYVINPEYIETLFDETVGQLMLAGALVLAAVGFYWMKKTIEIDI